MTNFFLHPFFPIAGHERLRPRAWRSYHLRQGNQIAFATFRHLCRREFGPRWGDYWADGQIWERSLALCVTEQSRFIRAVWRWSDTEILLICRVLYRHVPEPLQLCHSHKGRFEQRAFLVWNTRYRDWRLSMLFRTSVASNQLRRQTICALSNSSNLQSEWENFLDLRSITY